MEVKFSNVFFERSMIFTSVTSLLFTAISVITNLTYKSHPVFNEFALILYIAAAVLSLIFFLIFHYFFDSKSKSANILRLFIFSMLFVGVGCVLLRGFVNPALLIILSMAAFFLYTIVFPPFYLYSDFEAQCEGKSGERIAKDLYKDKFIGEDFLQRQKSSSFVFLIIQIFIICFLSALPFITYQKTIFTYIFALLFFISSTFILHLLSIYKKEVYYAFMGFEAQWNHRGNILRFSVMMIAAGLIFGAVLSSNKALVKLNLKQRDFIYVEKQKPKTPPHIEIPEAPPADNLDLENMFGEYKPIVNLEVLFVILEILGVALIVFGVLLFLARPFVSGSFFEYMRQRRIKDFFREFITNFREMMKEFFHRGKKREAYVKTDSEMLKKSIEAFLKSAKKSKEKKAELDRLTTLFMKVIDWGERHAVPYSQNLAPMEYAVMLADYLRFNVETANVDTVLLTGRLFEKSLYSESLLSAEEEKEYKNAVSIITSME